MNKIRKTLQSLWSRTINYPNNTIKFAGEDHLGNKYYEIYKPQHDRKIQRYFERPDISDYDNLIEASKVPPVWDAWLRFRRKDPPAKEEVEDSEEYYRVQQERHAEKKKQSLEEAANLKSKEEANRTSSAVISGDINKPKRTIPQGMYERHKLKNLR